MSILAKHNLKKDWQEVRVRHKCDECQSAPVSGGGPIIYTIKRRIMAVRVVNGQEIYYCIPCANRVLGRKNFYLKTKSIEQLTKELEGIKKIFFSKLHQLDKIVDQLKAL